MPRPEDRDTAYMIDPLLLGKLGTWVLVKYRRAWTSEWYLRWLSERENTGLLLRKPGE